MEFEQEEMRLASVFRRRVMDFDDLQNELSGRDVGRIQRFIGNGAHSAEAEKNRERDIVIDHMLSELERLLKYDPEYAAAYNQTLDMLGEYEAAAEAARIRAEERLAVEQEKLDGMLDRAGELDDGRKVFRDAQGRVWTSDHELIDGMSADDMDWPPGSPLYERYHEQSNAVSAARTDVEEIIHYQIDVLGDIRDRMSDERNPPGMDEFDAMQERMQAERPAVMQAEQDGAKVAMPSFTPVDNVPVPSL